MRLLLATSNTGKRREFQRLLDGLGWTLLLPDDLGLSLEVDEDGDTFEQNAEKKARAYAAASGMAVLADDSGLVVDALDGAPGVHSARYAGVHGDSAANRARVLQELAGVEEAQRRARFVCVLARLDPAQQEPAFFRGTVEGRIALEERGTGGFGYDAIFIPSRPDDDRRTLAEVEPAEKDALSHRAKAAHALRSAAATAVPTAACRSANPA